MCSSDLHQRPSLLVDQVAIQSQSIVAVAIDHLIPKIIEIQSTWLRVESQRFEISVTVTPLVELQVMWCLRQRCQRGANDVRFRLARALNVLNHCCVGLVIQFERDRFHGTESMPARRNVQRDFGRWEVVG